MAENIYHPHTVRVEHINDLSALNLNTMSAESMLGNPLRNKVVRLNSAIINTDPILLLSCRSFDRFNFSCAFPYFIIIRGRVGYVLYLIVCTKQRPLHCTVQ